MTQSTTYKKGDRIGGRYLVHKALAGGMGEVYLCLDEHETLPYALKTFQRQRDGLREAFYEEVGNWVALEKHPNIVRCFFMRDLDGRYFALLEWVVGNDRRGTSLRDWLRRGPLDLREALDFAVDICRGLRHAQAKVPGIVHRDLKPENVLVNQSRIAKITDFGLAKVAQTVGIGNGGDVRQSNKGGTPLYMAPEQWRGEALDQRTDIYALGCILYELLTGRFVYQSSKMDELMAQHLEAPIPVLADHADLQPILERCLAKRVTDRYADVEELLSTLAALYQDRFAEPVRSEPTDQQYTAADYANRGATYTNLGRYEEAVADHTQAIELDPTLAEAYTSRGVTYLRMRRVHEALADHSRALELDPALSLAYINRGNVYTEMGRIEEALVDYSRAIELDPSDARAYTNRGTIYQHLKRAADALNDYHRAIEIDPNQAEAYANIGLLCVEQGKPREAYLYLEKAAELGLVEAAQMVEQIRQALGMGSPSAPVQQAFVAFQRTASPQDMRRAVQQYPFMTQPDYIAGIEHTIRQQVPPELHPVFNRRLDWLKAIAKGE